MKTTEELKNLLYKNETVADAEEVSLSDNSCFSRFAQKDFKITFVAWN